MRLRPGEPFLGHRPHAIARHSSVEFSGERDCLVAVLCFADDLEIVLHFEDRAEACPHECLVVSDEDADHAVLAEAARVQRIRPRATSPSR